MANPERKSLPEIPPELTHDAHVKNSVWSLREGVEKVLSLLFPGWKRLKSQRWFRHLLGFEETLWIRLVSDRETRSLVRDLQPERLSCLEISGAAWRDFGFQSYESLCYPRFDVCKDTSAARYDLIIADNVFEHLDRPYQAGKNIFRMLNASGSFLVVTPFLVRVHPNPIDCSRWTETGLKNLLVECGFSSDRVVVGSWGNRACVKTNFLKTWPLYNRYVHSLKNDPEYPVVVWALARK